MAAVADAAQLAGVVASLDERSDVIVDRERLSAAILQEVGIA
jgi:hypothetical protein